MIEELPVVERVVEIEREPLGLTVDVRVRIEEGLPLPLIVGDRVARALVVPEPDFVDVRVDVTVRDSVGLALVVGVFVRGTVPVTDTEVLRVAEIVRDSVGVAVDGSDGRVLTDVVILALVDCERVADELTVLVSIVLRDPVTEEVCKRLTFPEVELVGVNVADLVAEREPELEATAVDVREVLADRDVVRVAEVLRLAVVVALPVRVAVTVRDDVVEAEEVRLLVDVRVDEPVDVPLRVP